MPKRLLPNGNTTPPNGKTEPGGPESGLGSDQLGSDHEVKTTSAGGHPMIILQACPKCRGAVLEHDPAVLEDGPLCVNCGWRRSDIPPDVRAQVEARLGQPYLEDRYIHSRIGTGKPPLSGWQRLKRLRERNKALRNAEGAPDGRGATKTAVVS